MNTLAYQDSVVTRSTSSNVVIPCIAFKTPSSYKVNIPSYQVKKGDVIELREKSKKIQVILDSLDAIVRRGIPQWIEINKENFKGEVVGVPVREDITLPIQEQLIVELYSK